MSKYYVIEKNSPILFNMSRMQLGKADLVRHLSTTLPTLNSWIQRPGVMPLEKITLLAGLFGIPVEELVYCLLRNKPQINKKDKFGKWFLADIRERNKEEGI